MKTKIIDEVGYYDGSWEQVDFNEPFIVEERPFDFTCRVVKEWRGKIYEFIIENLGLHCRPETNPWLHAHNMRPLMRHELPSIF